MPGAVQIHTYLDHLEQNKELFRSPEPTTSILTTVTFFLCIAYPRTCPLKAPSWSTPAVVLWKVMWGEWCQGDRCILHHHVHHRLWYLVGLLWEGWETPSDFMLYSNLMGTCRMPHIHWNSSCKGAAYRLREVDSVLTIPLGSMPRHIFTGFMQGGMKYTQTDFERRQCSPLAMARNPSLPPYALSHLKTPPLEMGSVGNQQWQHCDLHSGGLIFPWQKQSQKISQWAIYGHL